MKCTEVDLGNGQFAIVCQSGRRTRAKCETPGCREESIALCDYPTPGGKESTCSRRMCRRCASPQGQNVDLCPPHARKGSQASYETGELGIKASRPPVLFEIPPGTSSVRCKSCPAGVFWVLTKAGKWTPVNPNGTSHFATCPSAEAHRKPREVRP